MVPSYAVNRQGMQLLFALAVLMIFQKHAVLIPHTFIVEHFQSIKRVITASVLFMANYLLELYSNYLFDSTATSTMTLSFLIEWSIPNKMTQI